MISKILQDIDESKAIWRRKVENHTRVWEKPSSIVWTGQEKGILRVKNFSAYHRKPLA